MHFYPTFLLSKDTRQHLYINLDYWATGFQVPYRTFLLTKPTKKTKQTKIKGGLFVLLYAISIISPPNEPFKHECFVYTKERYINVHVLSHFPLLFTVKSSGKLPRKFFIQYHHENWVNRFVFSSDQNIKDFWRSTRIVQNPVVGVFCFSWSYGNLSANPCCPPSCTVLPVPTCLSTFWTLKTSVVVGK